MSKLTFMASAAILTGLTAPILTLDYFLISMGDYLAALITTSMAVATAWLCLRSLHSNCHAEIRPRVLLPAAIASASSSSSPHRPTEPLAGRAVRTP
ncbi:hypothetical protein [Dyella flagellata]|nr:hypothetical protein [Dyella flagellata]